MNVSKRKHRPGSIGQRGFSFIEVMIGVFIFAVGMLALALLQSSLTRSQADANSRAVASALAEQVLERSLGFAQLDTDPTGTVPAYADIREANYPVTTVTQAGIPYTVSVDLIDYRWDGDSFECFQGDLDNGTDARCVTGTVPAGAYSDYKLMEVTVSWAGSEFLVQDGVVANNRLGSGAVTLSSVISSVASPTSGNIQTGNDTPSPLPPISYQPGNRPDIIRLALGDSKFKESTTPLPTIYRGDFIETNWDVITYSTTGENSSFLRREEFRAVSCECELSTTAVEANRPYVWGGDEYVTYGPVTKQTGTRVSGSALCDRCCADHHDNTGSTGAVETRFTPFNDDYNPAGNHRHYGYDRRGVLVEAGDGDTYLEACKMVRVDGFWQVGQDLRSEDRFVFPEDFLDDVSELDTYSAYIAGTESTVGAVGLFVNNVLSANSSYPADVPCIGSGNCPTTTLTQPTLGGEYPATLADGEFPRWTTEVYTPILGVPIAGSGQQLRSRSLYIDPLSADMRELLKCLAGKTSVDELEPRCVDNGRPGYGKAILDRGVTFNRLELVPFFDTQLTMLNSWDEDPTDEPVNITNEPIEERAYSRGVVEMSGLGPSAARVDFYRDNTGLLGTIPHVPEQEKVSATLEVRVVDALGGGGGGDPEPIQGITVEGSFSYVLDNGDKQPGIIIRGTGGALCSGDWSTGWSCIITDDATDPRVTFSGYGDGKVNNSDPRWACSIGSSLTATSISSTASDPTATFSLSGITVDGGGYNIVVQETSCS